MAVMKGYGGMALYLGLFRLTPVPPRGCPGAAFVYL
jgi:hypothetical protein